MSCSRPSILPGHLKASLWLIVILLVLLAAQKSFAQDKDHDGEKTFADWYTPLVFDVENTGAHYRAPEFPPFAQLPIIRPLPDPFQFRDGFHDPGFPSWERRRNEIKAGVEAFEIGPKPDCSDCTITSTYTPPATGSNSGSLAVVVTRNGKSLTLTSGISHSAGHGQRPVSGADPDGDRLFRFR